MKHKFTILTPTHNRADLLPRVYNSVKKQTYKDFVWLVINDHSTDNTKDVLREIQDEKVIDVRVFDNPHPIGGKHTVLKYGFECCDTPYLVDIDDDDELLPEALEVFDRVWIEIESEGREDIGSVRALTIDENGKILGDVENQRFFNFGDASFLDVAYMGIGIENVTCFSMNAVRKANIFPEDYYLRGSETFLSEGIFWGRLARLYQSRYIPEKLRLYHYSAISLTRHDKSKQHYLNVLISQKILFEEQNDYMCRYPKRYIRTLAVISILACALGVGYIDLLSHMKKGKYWIILAYPLGFVLSYYLFHGKYKKTKTIN